MGGAARKYFGTDGIRGEVGKAPITPDFFMRIGWAMGKILAKEESTGLVLIGKDTRISGYMFESALEAGFSAAGMDIRLLGPMPTPGVAFLTRNTRALAGVVISASHNPFGDNGIKFFAKDGTKLPREQEYAIEEQLESPMQLVSAHQLGKVRRIVDAARRYIEFCKSRVANDIDLKGIVLVLDCANGATYHIAPKVFEELGAKVICIGDNPNGLNINESCGACAPAELCRMVRESNADVGIALDGDGDRLIMVDSNGELLNGDELLYIIAKGCCSELQGGVVGTIMSNLGLERAVNDMGLQFFRADVGDRCVMEKLVANSLLLGGESSGHILHLGKTSTGDGIIAALLVMNELMLTGNSLEELKSGMQKVPQCLRNIPLLEPIEVNEINEVRKAVKKVERELRDKGRVVLRNSGTEPIARLMVEGEDEAMIEQFADQLADTLRKVIRQ